MARTNAASIVSGADADQLAESYGSVLESIQKGAISEQIKNKNYSGDATTGSVEINRFANAEVKAQGTARTASAGDKLDNSGKVTVNVDVDKEIVEEVSNKDVALKGIAGLVDSRKANHAKRMIADLDSTFFAVAEAAAAAVSIPVGTTDKIKMLEMLIQSVETTTNDYVDGVDRDMIVLTLSPSAYSEVDAYIDQITNGDSTINMLHRVRVFSNHRQTAAAVAMCEGSVAQLIVTDEYDAERIPLSNETAIELFYSRGTKAIMPDLIKKMATLVAPAA